MPLNRRLFLAAATSAITILPCIARAASHASDVFTTPGGDITIHPVSHASFVIETTIGVIFVDPVGDPAQYEAVGRPDLILITHHHGDHYNADTLTAIKGGATQIIANPEVYARMPDDLKAQTREVANGDNASYGALGIDAIPAYNTTPGREKYHPRGRDNGYVLNFDGFRIYISGDTEDIPEMRALEDIDLAFICMNLPFTMDAAAAADAVAAFRPTYVYPYHYRGKDGGTQDLAAFARAVGDASEVKLAKWYD